MAIDHRFIAQKIVVKIIADRARNEVHTAGPIIVKRAVVEQYGAEYSQKYNFTLDKDRFERELKKYGVVIDSTE